MKTEFIKESFFSTPKAELFAFHEHKDAFSLLTPKSANIETISTASTLKPSADIVRFKAHFLFFKFSFEMIHTSYEKNEMFVDEQKKGLFSSWRHEHRFVQAGWKQAPFSMLSDRIVFGHPLLILFKIFVKHRLKFLFKFRHQVTADNIHQAEKRRQKIVITGATGLIGKRVTKILVEKGYHVIAFVRDIDKAKKALGPDVETVFWDLNQPEKDAWKEKLNNAEAVIHLAGFPLFKKRWSKSIKEMIWNSRVASTKDLVQAISECENKPEVFITASAVGLYGSKVDDIADETHAAADNFLAKLCVEWENEAKKVDVRNVQLRIGIVLSRKGGALKEMSPLFRLGAGGPMGNKEAWTNWIHIEDMARITVMAIENKKMNGPYNAAGPSPVTMETFAKSIAKNLKRPCLMKYPVPLLKLLIGEAGKYMAGNPKVLCDRILKQDYEFLFKDIDSALKNELN